MFVFHIGGRRLSKEQVKTWTRLIAFSMHSGKKAVQITAHTDFSKPFFPLSENTKNGGEGKGYLRLSHHRDTYRRAACRSSQRAAGPLSLHTSAIISGPECYKIMPSLLLPSINNNCIRIQQSHVEKLANDTYMRASTHLETQIILIILHEISFSFPNLAPVRALSVACRGPLLFFPALLFPWKLLTRALAGYCAEPYHALLRAHRLLAETEENQFLRQLC